VRRAPERLNLRTAREFEHDLKDVLTSDRPQLVLDLSQVTHIDASGIDVLLHCMSEAMRRDGDVKLAAVSPQAATILELTRTDRLFESFDNTTAAARSFQGFYPNVALKQQMLVVNRVPEKDRRTA
jgi:anti-anti-sigma factor